MYWRDINTSILTGKIYANFQKKDKKMLQEFISSKIHRATVTDANLNYVGSITIDETLMKSFKNQRMAESRHLGH